MGKNQTNDDRRYKVEYQNARKETIVYGHADTLDVANEMVEAIKRYGALDFCYVRIIDTDTVKSNV